MSEQEHDLKIFVYPHWNGLAWLLRAITESGDQLGESDALPGRGRPIYAPGLGKDYIDAIREVLKVDHPDHRFVWVSEPELHPQLYSLIAQEFSEEGTPKPSDLGVVLCSTCVHSAVCAAGHAASAIGASITACQHYENQS